MMSVGFRAAGTAAVAVLGLIALAAEAQVNVTTYHNDISRTGQNIQETILTPANVNSQQFGKLFTVTVDGYVMAQPLYLAGVTIGGGTHNVLYVATGHDSVYAIDADSGAVYAQVSLIPAGGRTMIPDTDVGQGCDDIVPEVGIVGTPVIDPTTGTLYVVAKSVVGGKGKQYLHALDVGSLSEKFGGPVSITASVAGTGYDSAGSVVTFNVMQENQRPALLLQNGHLIIGWGSHCDYDPWHGWMMSYSASTLAQEAAFNTSPNGVEGGIWMSGGGPAADSGGNTYFSTGNGTWDGNADFADSVVKVGPPSGGALPIVDYFTPFDQASLQTGDIDVSAGAPVLLPALPSGQQLLALIGKNGTMFVLNQSNMGKYCPNLTPACTDSDPQIVQEIPNATSGVWGAPAYWNGNLYWGGANDSIDAFNFNTTTGAVTATPSSQSAHVFGFPGPTPSVSANGTTNGIVWALEGDTYASTCASGANCQVLLAYDATNLAKLLYTSSQAANYRDVPGSAVKFAVPTISNGKVYVGSQYAVSAYGQLTNQTPVAASPALSPAAGTYTSTQTVTLADATPNATIYYTTNGSSPTTSSAMYTQPLSVAATTTIEAIAVANGYAASPIASATYTIDPPSGSAGIAVSLTADTNVYGIAANGTAVTNGGMDFSGNAYSANLLGTTLAWSGSNFTLGAAGPASGARVQTIALPAGNYSALNILATGVNGSQLNQTFVVTYSDGTATSTTQSLSDWTSPQNYAGESIVATMPYRVAASGTTQNKTTYLYGYSFTLNGAKTVKSLTLPNDWNVVVLAVDLVPAGTVAASTPAASPTLSPAAGTYAAAQTVTLSDTTSGATIYYTTNGSAPTTGSAVYSAPITVSATTTIAAIAVAGGYTASSVSSAAYTINLPQQQGSSPVPVSLSAGADVYAIANNGAPVTNGGMDFSGNAYSESLLGGSLTWSGSTFTLGAAGTASGRRVGTIALPAGSYASLELLAAAVDGNQANETFVVTYTDGTATTVTQSLSDWTTPQNYAGESIAATMPYRITSTGGQQSVATYIYGYSFTLNGAKTVQSLTLPNDWNLVVMAVDLLPAAASTAPPTGPAAAPLANPAAGAYTTTQSVTLTDATPNAAIYYTTDGSTPTAASTPYTQPLVIAATTTVNAIAAASGYTASPVSSSTYTINPSTSPTSPTTPSVPVSLTADTNVYGIANNGTAVSNGGMDFSGNAYSETLVGATLTWSGSTFTMGAAGTASGSRVQTIALPAGNYASVNLLATAVNGGQQNQTFVVTYTDGTATTVTQSLSDWLSPQSYPGESTVLSMPYRVTASGGTQIVATYLYGYSLPINGAKPIKSITLPNNWNVVVMAIDLVEAPAATPTMSPAAGTYTAAQTVSLADTTPNATIYYTTNGTAPTVASAVYGGPLTVAVDTTIEAIAVASGFATSAPAVAAFSIAAASPVISPASGTYSAAQTVTLTDATPNATIYYTINGTAPTTASAVYTGPLTVSATTTIAAIAVATGYVTSPVASANLAIAAQSSAAGPSLSPATGTYTAAQTVTLADATPNATIYYTTDGSTPTTASAVYSAPLTIAATTIVNAIAVAAGFAASPVSTATYTIAQPVGSTPVAVGITVESTVYGIANAGTAVTNGGLDYSGNAYAEALVGPSITWSGSTFTMGAAGAASGLRAATISLPAGNYSSVNLLATAVNGNQQNQVFVVTYTDGTTTSITQSMSDWLTPQGYSGEAEVLAMPYRVKSAGNTQNIDTYLYGYSFALNKSKTVQSLALPVNWNLVVMAVDLAP